MKIFRIGAFVILASAFFSCRKEPVEVTEVTIVPATAEIRVGESAALRAIVLPDDATDKSLVWYVKDSQVAMVDEGVVTALKQGTTYVKARADNGKLGTCELLCYSGTVTKGTQVYPVESADGHRSPSFDEYPGDIQISIHARSSMDDQVLRLDCPGRLIGEKVDMNKRYDTPDPYNYTMWMLSSFRGENDGYLCVMYTFGQDAPRVVNEMWASQNLSVNEGSYFKFCRLSATSFSFDCDVTLSDGTHWACEWSGYANIKD